LLGRPAKILLVALWALPSFAQPAKQPAPSWVARSDENAKVLLDVWARFRPEVAGRLGVPNLDEQVLDLKPHIYERYEEASREALKVLEGRLEAEKDAAIRGDLEILVQASKDGIEGNELSHKYELPYFDVPQTIFQGLRALLEDQIAPERRAKALVRLRRYTGLEPGYTPLTLLAADRLRESFSQPGLAGPFKGEVEKHLANSAAYVDGIEKLFARYKIEGFQDGLAKLRRQIDDYNGFVRREVLPKSRADFRLPREIYAFDLKQYGVDIPPEVLADRARIAFMEIRNEMRALAPLVAKEKSSGDYRDVIRDLKTKQIVGEAILPLYQKRMHELEDIIRREGIVTLPAREARIRLATEAESAATPAPNMRPPRLIGNTGEMGEFLLPLTVPTTSAEGKTEAKKFDDFTFDAASWTLTVHEGRPGHELQFAAIVEKGVSTARAVFAANSVNIEGWALYCEAEMKPYLPLDGQLISLQHRLLRAARAFLDPELQSGQIQPEQAVRFLMDEVVLSEPMARSEVERYTFWAPGQATSYFYGYTRWLELRSRAEFALGKRFNRQGYHDFILSQGLLPPDVLAKAVMEEFAKN
jgi:hypothetical protein